MSKYSIEDTTLTAIGDAIRAVEGSSESIAVTDLAARIGALSSMGGGAMNMALINLGTSTTNYTLDISNYTTSNEFIIFFQGRRPSSTSARADLGFAPWFAGEVTYGRLETSSHASYGFTNLIEETSSSAKRAPLLNSNIGNTSLSSYMNIHYENGIIDLNYGKTNPSCVFYGTVLLIYCGG